MIFVIVFVIVSGFESESETNFESELVQTAQKFFEIHSSRSAFPERERKSEVRKMSIRPWGRNSSKNGGLSRLADKCPDSI